jgi:hypothetical protein
VGEGGIVEAIVDKAGGIKVGEFKTACFLRGERVVVGFEFVSGGGIDLIPEMIANF